MYSIYGMLSLSDKSTLSSADVAKLLQDPNGENRALAATKVAATFDSEKLTENERVIAEQIFRHMLRDAEVRVRQALSESLKENPEVPHDVAAALAKDVDEVAMPVIESSLVLTDADLIEIVKSRGSDVQKTVAGRKNVSSEVADALVDEGSEDAVAVLVGNNSAQVSDATFGKVLDKFGDSEIVQVPMANREELPISVAERLVTLVSEQMKDHILTHHEVSPSMASDLLLESREKATVSLLDGNENSVQALVDQLHENGRLTPTLMLRALVMGDVTFFEVALAKRVNIPVMNAYKLVHDGGSMGLQKLFQAAKMPPQSLVIARSALDLADEMLETAGDDRDMFKQLMIERVLTKVEDEIDTDNLDYLIGKLHRKGNDQHTS